jgi:hypothetical protein
MRTNSTPRNVGKKENFVSDGPHGNQEHYHLYCREPSIASMRQVMQRVLDVACEDYCGILVRKLGPQNAKARLEVLWCKLRELEMDSARVMRAMCKAKDRRAPMRTKNRTYQCTEADLDRIFYTLGDDGVADTTKKRPLSWWSCLMGLHSMAKEKHIPEPSGLCVLDLSYMGVYPDCNKEWHDDNCKLRAVKNKELPEALLCIEGILCAMPNLMQGAIKVMLDLYEKTLLEKYPQTEVEKKLESDKLLRTMPTRTIKPHWFTMMEDQNVDESAADSDREDMFEQDAGVASVMRTRQVRKYPCKELICKIERRVKDDAMKKAKKRTHKVSSANAKCSKCLDFLNTVKMATGVEEAIVDDPAMVDRLAKALDGRKSSQRVTDIFAWIHKESAPVGENPGKMLGSGGKPWPAKGAPGGATNRKQTMAIRRVTMTLALSDGEGGRMTGADGSFDNTQLRKEESDSAATCSEIDCQDSHMDATRLARAEMLLADGRLCNECARPVKRFSDVPPRICIYCKGKLTSLDESGRPCARCRWRSRLCRTSTADRVREIRIGLRILLTTPDIRTIEELNVASDETVLAMIQASVQVGHGVTGFTGSSPLTIQARRGARKGRAAKKRSRVRERGARSSSGEGGGESDDVLSIHTDGGSSTSGNPEAKNNRSHYASSPITAFLLHACASYSTAQVP